MTVKELREGLAKYDPDHEILICVDDINGDTDYLRPLLHFSISSDVIIVCE